MIDIRPDYLDRFLCAGEHCKAQCPAPADMTWMWCLGDTSEEGRSIACPEGAKCILLRPERLQFKRVRVPADPVPLEAQDRDRLELMLSARKTMDIILQNRSLPMRSNIVLALTYGAEFEPMIDSDFRYAFEELDWGYTEQPYRQLSSVVQLQGSWELKRNDLLHMLMDLRKLSEEDELLSSQFQKTFDLFEPLSGMQYKEFREEFDAFLAPREYLFENLMVYLNHRYFMAFFEEKTIAPALQFSMVYFTAIRAMAFRLYRETGRLTDDAFMALCRHFSRCFEENAACHQALLERLRTEPTYQKERLQRLLWQ